MPKLPTYQDVGNVSPTIARDPGITAPVSAFQSGLGIAAKELSPGISDVADIVRAEEKRINAAKVNDSRRELLDFETEQQNWLAQQKGENVFGAKAALDAATNARVSQIKENLQNNEQRYEFNTVEQNWRAGFNRTASHYIASEMDKHYDDVDKKLIETSSRAAQKSASMGEFDRVQGEWSDQEKVISGYSDRKGFTDAERQAMLDSHKSNFHSGITTQLIADDKIGVAKDYLNSNKDDIDPTQRIHLENMIKSRQRQDVGEARTLLQEKLQDGYAMAASGVAIPNGFVPQKLIDAAYPDKDVHAEQAKRKVDLMYRYSNDVASLKTMNNDDLHKFVTETRSPSVSRPDQFAEEANIQNALKTDAVKIINERMKTPMTYAAENKIGVVNKIDFTDPKSIATEMPNRVRAATTMSNMFGSPFMPLEKDESAALGRYADSLTYEKKINLFDNLYQSTNDPTAYRSVMQNVRPDSPVSANIGILMGKAHEREAGTSGIPVLGLSNETLGIPEMPDILKSRNINVGEEGGFLGIGSHDVMMDAKSVAMTIARGEDILNPMKADKQTDGKPKLFKMPPEEQLRMDWKNYVGNAYGSNHDAEEHTYQAYRAFYAAAAVDKRSDDTAVDHDISGRAARAVTGGITSSSLIGGSPVVLPWGMPEDEFVSKAQSQWKYIKQELPNKNTSLKDVKLMSMPSEGLYQVYEGTGPIKDKHGQDVMLRIK